MVLAGLLIIAVIVSIGCMIYDIAHAYHEHKKDDVSGLDFIPATYIANAVVNFILVLFVIWIVVKARKEDEELRNVQNQAYQQPSYK